jgi:hypothetical protein
MRREGGYWLPGERSLQCRVDGVVRKGLGLAPAPRHHQRTAAGQHLQLFEQRQRLTQQKHDVRLAGRGVFRGDVPLGLLKAHMLPAGQKQLGLAHHLQQDQMQADLELPADVGLESGLRNTRTTSEDSAHSRGGSAKTLVR